MAMSRKRPAKRVPTPTAKKPPRVRTPLVKASDFRVYLAEKAALIAPRDLEALLARRAEVILKIARDCIGHERMARQLELALDLLDDYAKGQAPQIPYHTASVLTAAVLDFMNALDVIPDQIRGIGTSDDALVIELAFSLAGAGIERYCTATERSTAGLLDAPAGSR
jgi:uncharacterized membrane protein YkvA (DUF1232 family)